MTYAYPDVGRTGLANMLFPWARAEVFCRREGAQLIAPHWTNYFRIGPWLRGERDKRYYRHTFATVGMLGGWRREVALRVLPKIDESASKGGLPRRSIVVVFRGMEGCFSPFLEEREWIARRLQAITDPGLLQRVDADCGEPFIGVHIRRGDFQRGGIAIPDDWYRRAVAFARRQHPELPVRVYSDAAPKDLAFLADIAQLRVMPRAPALQDLLALSRARFVVGSSRSTFSMWTVFLGQMPSVWHPCERPPQISVCSAAEVHLLAV